MLPRLAHGVRLGAAAVWGGLGVGTMDSGRRRGASSGMAARFIWEQGSMAEGLDPCGPVWAASWEAS
jgi:hypothetical protein